MSPKRKQQNRFLKKLDEVLKGIEPAEEKDPKLAKAEAALKRWNTKLKRAINQTRKLAKQVAYYRKKAIR